MAFEVQPCTQQLNAARFNIGSNTVQSLSLSGHHCGTIFVIIYQDRHRVCIEYECEVAELLSSDELKAMKITSDDCPGSESN
jgi:hypothetical protein